MESIKSGYTRLDDKGIIKKGALTMIYSRPGMGKSALLRNLFVNIISQIPQPRCLYFSMEEYKNDVCQKMVAIKSGVPLDKEYWDKRYKSVLQKKEEQAQAWLEKKWNEGNDVIDDVESVANMILCIAERKLRYGLDVVFIDYLQLIQGYADDRCGVLAILKEMAIRLDIAVVVASQMWGQKDDGYRIECINTKESSVADVVIVLHRPKLNAILEGEETDGREDNAQLFVVKKRKREYAVIDLGFDNKALRFYPFENKDVVEEPVWDTEI